VAVAEVTEVVTAMVAVEVTVTEAAEVAAAAEAMVAALLLLTTGADPGGITDPVPDPTHLVVTDSIWGPRDRRWIFPKNT